MKKVTLWFEVLAAIVAVTILQASAGAAPAQPTLNPAGGAYPHGVWVKITTTPGAHLRFWIVGYPVFVETVGASAQVWVPTSPPPGGTNLKAKAFTGVSVRVYSSAAVGIYYSQ